MPARAIFEKLGATVSWDSTTQKVAVSLNGKNIALIINSDNAVVDNKTVKLDVPAKIINNRTMFPMRFVGEELGMKVDWLPEKSLITIDNIPTADPISLTDVSYSTTNNPSIDIACVRSPR